MFFENFIHAVFYQMHTLLSFFPNPSYDILTQIYDIFFNPQSPGKAPICTWLWGHLLGHGQYSRGHNSE